MDTCSGERVLIPSIKEMTVSEAVDYLIRLRDRSAFHDGGSRIRFHVEGEFVKVKADTAVGTLAFAGEETVGAQLPPEGEFDDMGVFRSRLVMEKAERERKRREAEAKALREEYERVKPLALAWPDQKARALAIGKGEDGHLKELLELVKSPSYEVRRLTASAMKKRMEHDRTLAPVFVPPLFEALKVETYHQAQQYMLSAIKVGSGGIDIRTKAYLEDVARDATLAPYIREAASGALAELQTFGKLKESLHRHWCHRCKKPITKEESESGIAKYGKPYCRHCLDERILSDSSFDRDVELAKKRRTMDGTAVQSRGEVRIANELARLGVAYEYDARYRIVEGTAIRPDFYLREFDLYIEYWGMNTPEYLANRAKKLELYQRAGKKLISLSYEDDASLEECLRAKLRFHIPSLP